MRRVVTFALSLAVLLLASTYGVAAQGSSGTIEISGTLTAGGTLQASIPGAPTGQVFWYLEDSSGNIYPIFQATTSVVDASLPADIPQGAYTLKAVEEGTTLTRSVSVASMWSVSDTYGDETPFQAGTRYGFDQVWKTGDEGQGQTIAVPEQSDVDAASLAAWDVQFGLPEPELSYPLGHQGDVVSGESAVEATMDVEWIHALAPMARILLYISPGGWYTAPYGNSILAAQKAGASVYAASVGDGGWIDPPASLTDPLEQAFKDGLNIFQSTGDSGFAQPNLDEFPAEEPDVVAVGGTEISGSQDVYWGNYSAGGGGYGVTRFPVPAWQKPFTQSSNRLAPDVSFLATGGFMWYDGSRLEAGGTSLSSPMWGAVWALAEEAYAASHSEAAIPVPAVQLIYQIASATNLPPAFRNQKSGTVAPFSPEIGLGSPNVANLVHDILALFPTTSSPSTQLSFSDVPATAWYSSFVLEAAQRGFIDGYADGTFRPQDPITRGEFLAVLDRAFKVPTPTLPPTMPWPESGWALPYLQAAFADNLVQATDYTALDLNGDITRQEIALLVARAVAATGATLSSASAGFSDVPPGSYYATAINEVANAGIVTGEGNNLFGPTETATRAEAAAMIMRAVNEYGASASAGSAQ